MALTFISQIKSSIHSTFVQAESCYHKLHIIQIFCKLIVKMFGKWGLSLVFISSCFVMTDVVAREWYFKPGANLRMEFDDNILLRRESIGDVFGFRGSLFADSGISTDRLNAGLTTKVNAYQYWGNESNGLNRVDAFIYGHSSFHITERSSIGLNAAYEHNNAVTSELDTTGLTQNPVPRQMFNAAPHWNYLLSERQSVRAGYTHEDVKYDNIDKNSLINRTSLTSYKTDSLNVSYQHQWRENVLYYLSFSALWYQLTDVDRQTNNYNLSAGLDYNYSNTLKFNFMLGVRLTDSISPESVFRLEEGFVVQENMSREDSSAGPLFGLGFNKQFEYGYLDFDYNRSIMPSSIGQLLQVDRINIKSLYRVTEYLNLKLLVVINKIDEGTSNNGSNNSRIYYSVEPQLIWKFNRQMSLSASYRFRTQKYDNINTDLTAVSNGFNLSINYHWDKWSANDL